MKSLAPLAFAAWSLLSAAPAAHAQPIAPAAPTITDAWVKASLPGATVSAAYMHIKSAKPLKLVRVDTPVASIVELHNMTMKDGVMEMKAMDAVEIFPNKRVELTPGGMHVMLMQVKQPIKAGDKVPLTLTFEAADKKPLVVRLDAVARDQVAGSHAH